MFDGKKVIIFDMDGTLIDSIGIWNQVDSILIQRLSHITVPPDMLQLKRDEKLSEFRSVENPYLSYCDFLAKTYQFPLSPEETLTLRNEIADEFLIHHIDYKPHAEVLLHRLKEHGYTLVIATTTRIKNMNVYRFQNQNILQKAPIDEYFSLVYTSEDVQMIKPDPEVHRKILKTLGVKPAECLIFEDSLVGIEAANNAGIESVAIYDKYSEKDLDLIRQKATYFIKDYEELLSC